MKLLVSGKGGAGKSAVTILLAKKLLENGPVYVLDADESNRLLSRALGVKTPEAIADYLGGRKDLRDRINEYEKVKLDELSEDYLKISEDGIKFAVVGKIEEYGEGCACPYGFLSKELLKRIELGKESSIIVDTEAGIEHLGRGIEEGIDKIIVIVDPTAEGVEIARMLKVETERINKPLYVVLNKTRGDLGEIMKDKLKEAGLEISAEIKYDEEIFRSSLEGEKIQAKIALEGILDLAKSLRDN
jgi:CO dehydrogenase maturation factor